MDICQGLNDLLSELNRINDFDEPYRHNEPPKMTDEELNELIEKLKAEGVNITFKAGDDVINAISEVVELRHEYECEW